MMSTSFDYMNVIPSNEELRPVYKHIIDGFTDKNYDDNQNTILIGNNSIRVELCKEFDYEVSFCGNSNSGDFKLTISAKKR